MTIKRLIATRRSISKKITDWLHGVLLTENNDDLWTEDGQDILSEDA